MPSPGAKIVSAYQKKKKKMDRDLRDTFVPLHMVFHLFGISFLHFHIENSYTPYEAQLEFTPV